MQHQFSFFEKIKILNNKINLIHLNLTDKSIVLLSITFLILIALFIRFYLKENKKDARISLLLATTALIAILIEFYADIELFSTIYIYQN